MRSLGAAAGKPAAVNRVRYYRAAITMISTVFLGAASLASTVARAGVLPGDTQASHTAFISANFAMSVIQILAESNLLLSVPAWARKPSICAKMLLVCSAMLLPLGASATMPAR